MTDQQIFERLFDAQPWPRLVIAVCAEGNWRVIHANTEACAYFNKSLDVLKSEPFEAHIDAANKAHILQSFRVARDTKVPVSVQIVPHLPGSVRVQSFVLNPIVDGIGPACIIDMMARPPASDQDALRRERDDAMSLLTSVFDVSDVGILVTDHNRRIIRINETFTRIYGWQAIELLSKDVGVICPPDDPTNPLCDMNVHDAHDRSREARVLNKEGSVATVIVSSGVMELSGKRSFRMTTIVDITYLKQIERDLRAAKDATDMASRAKSSFLANMSHELRTPLNAIIGFSDLMITGTMGPIGNAHYAEYMHDIQFSARHLLSIINDVLDMSKIEAGKMTLDEAPMLLPSIIEDAVRLMAAKAKETGVCVQAQYAPDLPVLMGDGRLIRQVLLNLISNAVKFSGAGKTVRVCASLESDGAIVMQVCDEGIGIADNRLQDVLEPFGQAHDPRINKGQGTGLGLPLARAMMALHGGSLDITSRLDAGTTVTCRFPTARVKRGL